MEKQLLLHTRSCVTGVCPQCSHMTRETQGDSCRGPLNRRLAGRAAWMDRLPLTMVMQSCSRRGQREGW